MIEALKLFDPYNRQARLYPALLTLLPVIAAIVACFPTVLTGSVAGTVVSIFALCGGLYLLADLARFRGKRVEPSLLAGWDGWPSTRLLRHRDGDLPILSKSRYGGTLSEKMGMSWPTKADEHRDPAAADDFYRSATDWLREQTRGPTYSRLLAENINYGFRRNLLGLKPVGLLLSGSSLIGLLVEAGHLARWSISVVPSVVGTAGFIPQLAAGAVCLAALIFWAFTVKPAWVKHAGDEYARSLLACCDTLN